MIFKQYIKDFENFGLGMFVHFGLYSVIGHGEWVKFLEKIPDAEYDMLTERFDPDRDWAEKLVKCPVGSVIPDILLFPVTDRFDIRFLYLILIETLPAIPVHV